VKGAANPKRPEKFALPAVAVLALGSFLFTWFFLIRSQGPFCWDEAHHSTLSALIARSLGGADLREFGRCTNMQIYWPFFHSWVSAPFLLVFGYSYAAARSASAVLGAGAIMAVFAAGRAFTGGRTLAPGMLAAAGLALSPMFYTMSSTAMFENLGLLLTCLLCAVFLGSWRGPGRRRAVLVGVLLAALYFTKYIYGIFTGVALAAFWLSCLLPGGEREDRRRILKGIPWTALGFLLPWGLWIAFPPRDAKLGMLFYRIGDTGAWNPMGLTFWETHLFFVRALLYAYSFSSVVYLAYLGGIVYGVLGWRGLRSRFLLLLFLSSFVPMSLIVNSQERFIYVQFPALLLLSAAAVLWAWRRLSGKPRLVAGAAATVLLAGDAVHFPSLCKQTINTALAVNLQLDTLYQDYSVFFGLASYPRWLRFPREHFNPRAPRSAPPEGTESVYLYVRGTVDPRYALCAPAHLGTLSPHLWHWKTFAEPFPVATGWDPRCAFFLGLEVGEESPYRRLGNMHLVRGAESWNDYYRTLRDLGLIREYSRRTFPGLGITAVLYARTAALDRSEWRRAGSPP